MTAVCDAGPLIHLSWLERIDLLPKLFGVVVVPPAIRDEVFARRGGIAGLEHLRAAFANGEVVVRDLERALDTFDASEFPLQRGEMEAIALAEDVGADLVLTDDLAARVEAERRGLLVVGTVGVLMRAHHEGLISSAVPLVMELRELGQWLSDSLVQFVQESEAGLSS